mmetsp:Transcript_67293/g.160516  ORF Transcript_67293/g.160516 Transcript_67293/m.160516 type:complete len:207 (-) Transcript_67293:975-1595(-)
MVSFSSFSTSEWVTAKLPSDTQRSNTLRAITVSCRPMKLESKDAEVSMGGSTGAVCDSRNFLSSSSKSSGSSSPLTVECRSMKRAKGTLSGSSVSPRNHSSITEKDKDSLPRLPQESEILWNRRLARHSIRCVEGMPSLLASIPKTDAMPVKTACSIAMNSPSSKVRLSFSSNTPSKKRIFCFLEMEADIMMQVVRNAGTETFTLA